jgi:hypothetical protein
LAECDRNLASIRDRWPFPRSESSSDGQIR